MQEKDTRSKYQFLLLAIPTVFDLIATVLMNIGLLNVTASVYQMMRGAEMLFAAVFAVLFLHRRLNKYHLLGILCCVVSHVDMLYSPILTVCTQRPQNSSEVIGSRSGSKSVFTTSIHQMMRGAEMLFAAVFAVLFLNRRLNKYYLLGIMCCDCALQGTVLFRVTERPLRLP